MKKLKSFLVDEKLMDIFKGVGYDNTSPEHRRLKRSFEKWYHSEAQRMDLPEAVVIDMLRGAIEDIELGEL